NERPAIGEALYAAPKHICPTSALYPSILVVQDGEIIDQWLVTARNRKITI
ncbi:MAG: D-TA family PLP-dependent enzyme, partial [Clostridia bacterium]